MLRAYPQDHPKSQHICNSRVSRPPHMATRQPGITPKYGILTYILGLSFQAYCALFYRAGLARLGLLCTRSLDRATHVAKLERK